ncbi:MAG: hypothetical protein GYA31_02795, partial [Parcubacteria group bacterium]|nr:hypothetical protein [Parcubacteria group bacterium]
MKTEIDQSGKIEQTNIDTIIALSNNVKGGVILNRKVKHQLQDYFRRNKKSRIFSYIVFSVCIAILLKELKIKQKVIVDLEYLGHNEFIRTHVCLYLKRLGIKHPTTIFFASIGKHSPADNLANKIGK